MTDAIPSDGNGGISGGAEEIIFALDEIGREVDMYDYGLPTFSKEAMVAMVEAVTPHLAAAYRAGMLRALEIVDEYAEAISDLPRDPEVARECADLIRAEAAGGTPPDPERQ